MIAWLQFPRCELDGLPKKRDGFDEFSEVFQGGSQLHPRIGGGAGSPERPDSSSINLL